MSLAEFQADPTDARRAGRKWGGLSWAMLAAIVVLAVTAAVAMSGWSTAIDRADAQTTRAAALQATADNASGLQQRIATLQHDLADAHGHEQALAAQLMASGASLDEARDKAAAAEQRSAAAAAEAEHARADLQARLDARPPVAAGSSARGTPQPAANISAATVESDVAPDLPLPGLPPDATARDYLVAAQQAVRESRTGRAQSALEHAETRLLNLASLHRNPGHPVSHPGVAEIERALDQLGSSNTDGALQTIDWLLTRP